MWNRRSWLLYARIRLRGKRPSLNLALPLALFAPQQLLLASSGLLALIPGEAGRWARMTADTLHGLLLQLTSAPPLKIADIKISDKSSSIRVLLCTWGFGGGDA
jgi:hypothetical protein